MIVDLDYMGLVDLSILDKYDKSKITELYIYHNELTTLKGIDGCINLEVLRCGNNQLTSLNGIEKLVKLEKLFCNDNQITSLQGIENLVKLEQLSCNENPLKLIKNINVLYEVDDIRNLQHLVKNELLSEVINNLNI